MKKSVSLDILAPSSARMEAWRERKRERTVKGRKVVASLRRTMRRTTSMEVKEALWDSIIVPKVVYSSETWRWNKSQKSRIQAVEMSYLRGACGVSRVNGESNENVNGKFIMSSKGEGMSPVVCGW